MTSDLLLLLDDIFFTDVNVYAGSGGSVSGHFQDILVLLRLKISALQIAVTVSCFSPKRIFENSPIYVFIFYLG